MPAWFAPEVVQTSAMDCGPAALTSLLNGFRIPANYGRLREACQTDVDGTSIDVLEEVANQLGLEAEQIMLPVDHLLLSESAALPAIVVTRTNLGATHFVVVWKVFGKLVQVMDPATGRRWIKLDQLLQDLYVHTQEVPAEIIDGWLRSEDFQRVIRRRLKHIGVKRRVDELLAEALQTPDWQGPAALDAAIRLTSTLVQGGALRRGSEARQMVVSLLSRASADRATIPEDFWFVLPATEIASDADMSDTNTDTAATRSNEASEAQVRIRGAVLVRAVGISSESASDQQPPLSAELSAALNQPKSGPWKSAFRTMGGRQALTLCSLGLMVCLISILTLTELVFLRSFIDLGRDLGLVQQRLTAVGILVATACVLLVLELSLCDGVQRLGRKLEVSFRLAFTKKIPRLNDRYFQSRPISDMTERSHMVAQLRNVPRLLSEILQTSVMLILTAIAIAICDPASGPLALSIAVVSIGLPILFRPWLAELDMRVRTHGGALTQFYFDAMHGLSAIRSHVAQRTLVREQEALLVEWVTASRRHLIGSLCLETAQQTCGIGLAAWLVARHVEALSGTGGALLLAWWALSLPEFAGQLTALARQYPMHRNILLRLMEPLNAPEADDGPTKTQSPEPNEQNRSGAGFLSTAAAVEFRDVAVVAGGHCILHGINFAVPAGSHVAIVGPSGGGKSTLLGLLLGWHSPAHGQVHVDGQLLTQTSVKELREQTAWVDPSVQIWNETLVDNLRFGQDNVSADQLGRACDRSSLIDVLERLPQGLQTKPGEGGTLLSGGQGQRIRLGRAIIKEDARLVLLDEAFRGLEHNHRRQLTEEFRQQFRNSTVLSVSHDVRDTLSFDRVIVVDHGQVVEDGDPVKLAADEDSRYSRLLESEEEVRRTVWEASTWRHLWLNSGRLSESRVSIPSENIDLKTSFSGSAHD